MTQASVHHGAKWSVMWKTPKGKIARKRFDENFPGALKFYTLLVEAGKSMVTLHCDNIAFPPPTHLRDRYVTRTKIKKVRGKRKKVKVQVWVEPMKDLNAKGAWWCPYCIKLRAFKKEETRRSITMSCSVCGVTNRMWAVRRWNPQAQVIEYRRKTRRSSGVRRRRRRT